MKIWAKKHLGAIAIGILLVCVVSIVVFGLAQGGKVKDTAATLPADTQPSTQETQEPTQAEPESTEPETQKNEPESKPKPKPTDPPPTTQEPEKPTEAPAGYQAKYPELYVSHPQQSIPGGERLAYLTFDDGPSKNTANILDILDEKGVKATFFVLYRTDEFSKEMYRQIVNRGHTLAIHSASHDYKKIYSSVSSFLDDFNQIYQYLYEVTGVKCTLFRFPGGSTNDWIKSIRKQLEAEMKRRGFSYWDWSVDSGDAESKPQPTRDSVYERTVGHMNVKNRSVILMHDAAPKHFTVEALPDIIQNLKDRGYRLSRLEDNMQPQTFDW